MAIELEVNGQATSVDAPDELPLLWVLRERLGLTGTKFACGVAACGACTVHLDGQPVRSCSVPIMACAGKRVTTIEGLTSAEGEALRAAWIALQVPQCGYCQTGMLMAAAALLARHAQPSETEIERSMTNLCRCGTYPRVRAAIRLAAAARAGA